MAEVKMDITHFHFWPILSVPRLTLSKDILSNIVP